MLRGIGVSLVSCADALGVNWTIDLSEARAMVSKDGRQQIVPQGNMDPCILYSNPDRPHLSIDEEEINEEVGNVLASFGNGHVFNLGHGIHPKIDPENIGAFINAAHELSGQYHQ